MTPTDAKAWLRTFGDTPDELRQPCRHGHKECSTTHRGECLDEAIRDAVSPPEDPNACVCLGANGKPLNQCDECPR